MVSLSSACPLLFLWAFLASFVLFCLFSLCLSSLSVYFFFCLLVSLPSLFFLSFFHSILPFFFFHSRSVLLFLKVVSFFLSSPLTLLLGPFGLVGHCLFWLVSLVVWSSSSDPPRRFVSHLFLISPLLWLFSSSLSFEHPSLLLVLLFSSSHLTNLLQSFLLSLVCKFFLLSCLVSLPSCFSFSPAPFL